MWTDLQCLLVVNGGILCHLRDSWPSWVLGWAHTTRKSCGNDCHLHQNGPEMLSAIPYDVSEPFLTHSIVSTCFRYQNIGCGSVSCNTDEDINNWTLLLALLIAKRNFETGGRPRIQLRVIWRISYNRRNQPTQAWSLSQKSNQKLQISLASEIAIITYTNRSQVNPQE